ncbi:MAG: hypothetical protein HQ582_19265, partial [Planctomycetes bacterium]|nr:hypothetical protein [Planctomycetota bacterium]
MTSTKLSQIQGRRALASFHLALWILAPAFLLVTEPHAAEAQFRELLSHVPSGANAVVLLNVEKAEDSPYGISQGWRVNRQKAFEDGLMRVPPQATRFVLATQLDLEFMHPIWEVAVVNVNEPVSLGSIAQRRSGKLDNLGSHLAVALPNDTYVLQFDPETLGAMAPANRQAVLRWTRELDARSDAAMSPYLKQAAGYSDDAGTEIIIALDLEGHFHEGNIQEYLKAQKLSEASGADQQKLAKLLAGVRGVRLGVRIGEKPFGKVVVDFGDDTSMMATFAKPLLLQVLADAGATIGDLAEWKSAAQGNTVSLEGHFSADGLRRVLSVVESPAPAGTGAKKGGEIVTSDDPEEMKKQKSLEHFHAVGGMLNDLKRDMKDIPTLSASQLWFDKYARRIERLPILNVDEDLLDYSAYIAQSLRACTGAVKTMGIRGGVRESQITSGDGTVGHVYGGGYRYGRYGGYGGYGGYSVY